MSGNEFGTPSQEQHPKPRMLIVDNTDREWKSFNEQLTAVVSRLAVCNTLGYDSLPDYEDIADSYDGIILSGVPIHYSYESADDRLRRMGWLRDSRLPTLGICLGHQMIGKTFGASLIQDEEKEAGTYTARILQDDPIFNDIPKEFRVFSVHRGSIPVPSGFTLLASTERDEEGCKNAIMRHAERSMYGTQFHPEFSPYGEVLLKNFVDIAASQS